MPRALILSYYFPPLGGAGVQRTAKLVKHLPAFGWDPVVVTAPDGAHVPWAPDDPTLGRDIPDGTTVVRVATAPPAPSLRESRRRRLLGAPSVFDRWWAEEALNAALTVMDGADLVYASMSPFSTAAAAEMVAREAGLPWVADLRDPWALDDWASYPSALHRRVERHRMRRALRAADAVVMNTEDARAAVLRAFAEIDPGRVSTIPNGWDRDDFAVPEPVRDDDSFRVVLAGYSHTARRDGSPLGRGLKVLLGGSTRGIQPAARSHTYLLDAVRELASTDPDLVANLEVHVAGPAPPGGPPSPKGARVVHHGYLPHDEAVMLMRSADLLFLPMHGLPTGVRTTTVGGKTYEYLAARRPILAALPEGDARDLLTGLPDVWTCRPTEVRCLASGLREMIARGRGRHVAEPSLLERYERKAIAGRLVSVFDGLVGRDSPASREPAATEPRDSEESADAREHA